MANSHPAINFSKKCSIHIFSRLFSLLAAIAILELRYFLNNKKSYGIDPEQKPGEFDESLGTARLLMMTARWGSVTHYFFTAVFLIFRLIYMLIYIFLL